METEYTENHESQKKEAHVFLEKITKRYGKVIAANNVSLEIAEHEFVTLLGPSGSGKTTLLMTVAGFTKADSGRIYIGGKDISDIPPYKRNIGMVFQNYALFPHMTVYDNVAYPLKMRQISRMKARPMVERTLETVELQELGGRHPIQLSGGQQQRVALARALVFRPPILLMDEPLGALDKNLREHMQIELKHLQEQLGITILYVTHDQGEALTMSSRIAIMNNGQVEQLGTALELYEQPVNQFVADFVGETNFFSGEIVQLENDIVYIAGRFNKRIRAKALKKLKKGESVHLAVRPEKICFIEKEEGNQCCLEGRVEDIIYLGDTTKYYVRLLDTPPGEREGVIVMKVQNRLGTISYKRGDQVRIGWNELDAPLV